jgi:hypothetical protein
LIGADFELADSQSLLPVTVTVSVTEPLAPAVNVILRVPWPPVILPLVTVHR